MQVVNLSAVAMMAKHKEQLAANSVKSALAGPQIAVGETVVYHEANQQEEQEQDVI